jgi:uncharacterized protein YecE (DUF72 family)
MANLFMARSTDSIRIGPAGWSYPDWKGIVYPLGPAASGSQDLEFISQYFDTVEINTSFYRPLRAEIAKVWLRKIASNDRFQFTAKLLRRFTHERDAGPAEESACKEGFAPLLEDGKLGALLLQFPWSFRNTAENQAYLEGLFAKFAEYPIVLEVRHASWNSPEILELLQERGVGFCNIDQPQFGSPRSGSSRSGGSMPATARVTAPVGYVRLHGRNYNTWFAENAKTGLRYDYLYTPDELREWQQRIESVAARSQSTYVILNNHYRGQAVANAFQLAAMIRKKPVPMPPGLLELYPDLEEHSSVPVPQGQLFPRMRAAGMGRRK